MGMSRGIKPLQEVQVYDRLPLSNQRGRGSLNTLSDQDTQKFFPYDFSWKEFDKHWKELVKDPVRSKQLTVTHHMLAQMIRGRDWRKGLTPPSSRSKIANGYIWKPILGLAEIRASAISITEKNPNIEFMIKVLGPFEEVLHPHALQELAAYLPFMADIEALQNKCYAYIKVDEYDDD